MEVEHDPLEYDASQEPVPLEFEEFSDRIDTWHGYVTITKVLVDLETDQSFLAENGGQVASVLYGAPILPDAEEFAETEEYSEECRGKIGKEMDEWLALVSAWLDNPLEKPTNLADAQVRNFVRFATHFFKENGRVYRKSLEGKHKLVI